MNSLKETKEEKKLQLGFNKDFNNQEYHDDRDYVSSSGLKMMYKEPRRFHKTYVLNEDSMQMNQSNLDYGSYVHCRILEPHLEHVEFTIWEGASRRGKAWEFFRDSNTDKTIITKSQKYEADKLIHNFERAKVLIGEHDNEKEVLISSFFEGGTPEETLCVILNGIKVKVRFDYRKEFSSYGSINDIKTTASLVDSPERAEEVCAQFGYDVSAALYCDAVELETGLKHDFYFVFLCKKDGNTYIYKASEQMLSEGRRKYKIGLQRLKEARASGIYYKNVIQEIDSVEVK